MLFNVTIYDISVIYVTAHRCAGGLKKKLYLRSGSQRHRHFVGFFNVLVQAPTRGHRFYTVIVRSLPFSLIQGFVYLWPKYSFKYCLEPFEFEYDINFLLFYFFFSRHRRSKMIPGFQFPTPSWFFVLHDLLHEGCHLCKMLIHPCMP